MKKIWHLCLVLSVWAISRPAWAAEVISIEEVYNTSNKSTTQLDETSLKAIDDFWAKSIDTIMLSEDTEKIVNIRKDLIKYKGDSYLSFYASAYTKSAYGHLKEALETVGKWEENVKKLLVERNLIILIAELGRIELTDLVLPKLSSADPMIRYWAVRSLASPEIISQCTSADTKDDKRTAGILSALDGYLKTTADMLTLSIASNFAVGINTPASSKLLITIADKRIDAYMKWEVTDEGVDAEILKSMGTMGTQIVDPAAKQEVLSRFGQLYACVISRYMQSEKLPNVNRDQLISVIVEVEDKIISKQISGWVKFRTDISRNLPLTDDYNLLFGSGGRTGELAAKMNFNYGKDSSGKVLVSPRPLPAPPEPSVEAPAAAAKP